MKAILWDMDGTVLDSEPAHETAFDDAVMELGLDLPFDFHETLLGASSDQVHAALVAATGMDLTRAEWISHKWRHYQRHATRIVRREPSASLAEKLAARGVAMALVSNSTADEVSLNLAVTGMEHTFPVTVCRGDVQNGKPAPEGYLLAAKRLGYAPDQCLVVEDSPTGARAGLAAGMTVLFHPQSELHKAPPGVITLPPEKSPEDMITLFCQGRSMTDMMLPSGDMS